MEKIIFVDEQGLFRSGLESIIECKTNFQISGSFSLGKEVLDFLEDGGEADLIIMDLDLCILDGAQLLRSLQITFPTIKKLVLFKIHSSTKIDLCIKLEADGFLTKDASLDLFLLAVETIMNGAKYFQKSVVTQIALQRNDFYAQLVEDYELTRREAEILKLILHQYENEEIATKLYLSPLTIKTHRKNIFKKLKVRNLAGMVWLVINHSQTKPQF